jgi:hypothetical protein
VVAAADLQRPPGIALPDMTFDEFMDLEDRPYDDDRV